ncbi:MAG: PorT family protein [Saprospiraceae bacterium]|nr:PorT family protein [Saprospiraceae bacterium]
MQFYLSSFVRLLLISYCCIHSIGYIAAQTDTDSLSTKVGIGRDTIFRPYSALGARGFFSMTTVSFNPTPSPTFLYAYGGGLYFCHVSQKHLGIQIELNYIQKGWREIYTQGIYSRKLHYLELPFLTQVTAGKGMTNVVLNFGPLLSILLTDTEQISNALNTLDYYGSPINTPVELGVSAGLGLVFKTNGGHIQIEGRYSHNLLNIFDQQIFNTSQNMSITASLTYAWAWYPKIRTIDQPISFSSPPKTSPKKKKTKKKKTKTSSTDSNSGSSRRGGGVITD